MPRKPERGGHQRHVAIAMGVDTRHQRVEGQDPAADILALARQPAAARARGEIGDPYEKMDEFGRRSGAGIGAGVISGRGWREDL